jgi:hypothetical protein
MATIKTSGDLLASISADLSDNNAGLISAEDVRHNMEDAVRSINQIVASGDTDGEWPFTQDVRVAHDSTAGTGGIVYAESGIIFPKSSVDQTGRQQEPFLGIGNLSHNALANLTVDDPHTQYLNRLGGSTRPMIGNLALSTYWVGSEGTDQGLKFTPTASGDDITVSGTFEFQKDQSRMDSAHGVAKAWMNWSAVGGQVVVNSYHNIDSINASHNSGVFQITFTSGTFLNNNYTAIGISNGISSTGTYDAMQPNSVGITLREGDDGTSLRSLYFKVEQDDGDAVFAGHNDLVVYGYNPGSTSGVGPTITNYSS